MKRSLLKIRMNIIMILFFAIGFIVCLVLNRDANAVPALKSATPNPAILVPGGPDVLLTLQGSGLDQIGSCAVVRNKQIVQGVAVIIGPPSRTIRQIKLRAKDGTAVGDAQLRLMSGPNFLDVPLNIVRISIASYKNAAMKSPEVLPKAKTSKPTTIPTQPGQNTGSGGPGGIHAARQVSVKAQEYFNAVRLNSWMGHTSGSFQGTLRVDNALSSTYDSLQIVYTLHVCVPKPLVGGCIYEHDYDESFTWTLSAKGAINYRYNFPFTFNFTFPMKVYPGQHIRLEPNYVWGDPSIEATQDYEYYQETSSSTDAPFDGLGPLDIGFAQYSTRASIKGNIPKTAITDARFFEIPLPFFPFDQGGGEWPIGDHASMARLGGRGSLATSGGNVFSFNPAGEIAVWGSGTSAPAWQLANEHFEIAATVLKYIPATSTIGAGVELVRSLGKLRLKEKLRGSIYREDWIFFEISEMPYADVPADLAVGGTWESDVPVTIKYRVQAHSGFSYPLSYNIVFEMRGIDPQTLLNEPFISWSAAGIDSGWQEREIIVPIKVRIPVVPKGGYKPELVLEKTSASPAFVIPPKKMLITQSAHRPGVKVAGVQDTKRHIHKNVTVPFPKPTAPQGVPLTGHKAPILGTASQASAQQLISVFKSKGIDGYLVDVPGSPEKIISLGSFANSEDAQLMSGMLKEIFQIDSSVSSVIDNRSRVPIKGDVLMKLQQGPVVKKSAQPVPYQPAPSRMQPFPKAQ